MPTCQYSKYALLRVLGELLLQCYQKVLALTPLTYLVKPSDPNQIISTDPMQFFGFKCMLPSQLLLDGSRPVGMVGGPCFGRFANGCLEATFLLSSDLEGHCPLNECIYQPECLAGVVLGLLGCWELPDIVGSYRGCWLCRSIRPSPCQRHQGFALAGVGV